MSNPSEVKLLRDELARVIAEVKKRDRVLEQQSIQIEQMRIQIEQKDIQIEQLKGQPDKGGGRVTYYENPHSPPSANSIPARQRRKASRKDPAAHKKPGQKPGHRGASHSRRSSATVRHTPAACGGCGGGRLEAGRIADMRQATDIRPVPDADTVTRVAHDGVCGRCGHATEAPSLYKDGVGVAVRGTSLGPVLVSGAVQLWERHASVSGITDMLNDAFGRASEGPRCWARWRPRAWRRRPQGTGSRDRRAGPRTSRPTRRRTDSCTGTATRGPS